MQQCTDPITENIINKIQTLLEGNILIAEARWSNGPGVVLVEINEPIGNFIRNIINAHFAHIIWKSNDELIHEYNIQPHTNIAGMVPVVYVFSDYNTNSHVSMSGYSLISLGKKYPHDENMWTVTFDI